MENTGKLAEFVHIEKTSGTVVRAEVERNVGLEGVYIYNPQLERLAPSSSNLQPQTSNMIEIVRKGIDNPILAPFLLGGYALVNNINNIQMQVFYPKLVIPAEAKVLFGHFIADEFDNILSRDPIRGIIIRDPLDRMRSHYDHWKRNKGMVNWRVVIPYDRKVSFEQFAMLPELQNYQTQALGSLNIENFDVVGVSTDTMEFIKTFLGHVSNFSK